jgi:hypothetical protein
VELEIGLAHPDAALPHETFHEVLMDTRQVQQLVDDLLFLARSPTRAS